MSQFDFVAGQVALDFVNTVANRLDPAKRADLLRSPADLGAWFAAAGLPGAGGMAAAHLERARSVREDLRALFLACASGGSLPAAALAGIDRAWHACLDARRLIAGPDGVILAWPAAADPLDRALLPVLTGAVDLLVAADRARIGQCEGAGCGWLFLNRSRGSSPRRWCSMRDCGNRAKAGRHHARVRS